MQRHKSVAFLRKEIQLNLFLFFFFHVNKGFYEKKILFSSPVKFGLEKKNSLINIYFKWSFPLGKFFRFMIWNYTTIKNFKLKWINQRKNKIQVSSTWLALIASKLLFMSPNFTCFYLHRVSWFCIGCKSTSQWVGSDMHIFFLSHSEKQREKQIFKFFYFSVISGVP